MKLINNNLKKAGYVNAILIVATIVLRLIDFASNSTVAKINSIVSSLSLLYGLFYSLSGYKKEGAKYYKMSMIFNLFSSLVTLFFFISCIDYK